MTTIMCAAVLFVLVGRRRKRRREEEEERKAHRAAAGGGAAAHGSGGGDDDAPWLSGNQLGAGGGGGSPPLTSGLASPTGVRLAAATGGTLSIVPPPGASSRSAGAPLRRPDLSPNAEDDLKRILASAFHPSQSGAAPVAVAAAAAAAATGSDRRSGSRQLDEMDGSGGGAGTGTGTAVEFSPSAAVSRQGSRQRNSAATAGGTGTNTNTATRLSGMVGTDSALLSGGRLSPAASHADARFSLTGADAAGGAIAPVLLGSSGYGAAGLMPPGSGATRLVTDVGLVGGGRPGSGLASPRSGARLQERLWGTGSAGGISAVAVAGGPASGGSVMYMNAAFREDPLAEDDMEAAGMEPTAPAATSTTAAAAAFGAAATTTGIGSMPAALASAPPAPPGRATTGGMRATLGKFAASFFKRERPSGSGAAGGALQSASTASGRSPMSDTNLDLPEGHVSPVPAHMRDAQSLGGGGGGPASAPHSPQRFASPLSPGARLPVPPTAALAAAGAGGAAAVTTSTRGNAWSRAVDSGAAAPADELTPVKGARVKFSHVPENETDALQRRPSGLAAAAAAPGGSHSFRHMRTMTQQPDQPSDSLAMHLDDDDEDLPASDTAAARAAIAAAVAGGGAGTRALTPTRPALGGERNGKWLSMRAAPETRLAPAAGAGPPSASVVGRSSAAGPPPRRATFSGLAAASAAANAERSGLGSAGDAPRGSSALLLPAKPTPAKPMAWGGDAGSGAGGVGGPERLTQASEVASEPGLRSGLGAGRGGKLRPSPLSPLGR